MRRVTLIAAVLLAACGGGGGAGGGISGFCESFAGGTTDWSCNNCGGVDPLDENSNDFDQAIDGDPGTFTAFTIGQGGGQITITATAPAGTSFPEFSDGGAFMRFPTGTYGTIGVTFSTFNGAAPAGSGGGDSAAGGNVSGNGEDRFYPIGPTSAFDTIQAVVSATGVGLEPAEFRIYEVCGAR